MLIYLIILALILLVSIKNPYSLNYLDKLLFIFLALVSGLRYDVGTDYFGYVEYFNLITNGEETPAEIGFVVIANILGSLNLGSQGIFMVFSALTMFFIYQGLKYFMKENYTLKPVLYIIMIIFTYFPSLNGVRQALAAAILFYASKYIVKRNFNKFILWLLISMTFHLSSIFYILIYFIGQKSYRKFTMLFVLSLSFLITQLGLINSILEFLFLNLSFLDVGGYLGNYLYHSYNTREIGFGAVFYINLLVLILFIILKDKLLKNEKSLLAFNLFFVFILVGIWSMDAAMLSRLTYFFSVFMAITISKFGIIFEKNSKIIAEYSIISLYILLFLYLIVSGYMNPEQVDYIPYDYNIKFSSY